MKSKSWGWCSKCLPTSPCVLFTFRGKRVRCHTLVFLSCCRCAHPADLSHTHTHTHLLIWSLWCGKASSFQSCWMCKCCAVDTLLSCFFFNFYIFFLSSHKVRLFRWDASDAKHVAPARRKQQNPWPALIMCLLIVCVWVSLLWALTHVMRSMTRCVCVCCLPGGGADSVFVPMN